MSKRTVDDYKKELENKITSLLESRNGKLKELEDLGKEVQILMEQQLALDESKIRVKCFVCGGTGYQQTDDGKKQMCPMCGGPDKPYVWAEKYTE